MLECAARLSRGGFRLDARLNAGPGVTALVGPSGAGKSSLLRLLAGLERPEGGRISLDGEIWLDAGARRFVPAHKRPLGMVFQGARLLPHLDVARNIALGARGGGLDARLVNQTGCDKLLGKPVAGLSGGEKQRVMLARALHGKPRLLLLDEPLTGLDSASRDKLLGLLGATLPQLSIPVIYVTHSGEEAGRLARRFALMRDGRIVSSGDAQTVLGTGAGPQFEAGVSSVVTGRVTSVAKDGLARIALGAQSVEVPGAALSAGAQVQLRLWARDLVLASSRPEGISARNALTGTISALTPIANGQVTVSVDVDGVPVIALVMARTVKEMGLAEAMPIHVLFKSASVERVA